MPSQGVRDARAGWTAAALTALTTTGPAAVTVEGLARTLKMTKGSFYWHFGSRDELMAAALTQWAQDQTQALIDEAERAGSPADKLAVLFHRVAEQNSPGYRESALYQAATDEPDGQVALAVRQVTGARIDYVTELLVAQQVPARLARERAQLALALVIGSRVLYAAFPPLAPGPAARARSTALALAMMTSPGGRPAATAPVRK